MVAPVEQHDMDRGRTGAVDEMKPVRAKPRGALVKCCREIAVWASGQRRCTSAELFRDPLPGSSIPALRGRSGSDERGNRSPQRRRNKSAACLRSSICFMV